jgi:hypothetical protein
MRQGVVVVLLWSDRRFAAKESRIFAEDWKDEKVSSGVNGCQYGWFINRRYLALSGFGRLVCRN